MKRLKWRDSELNRMAANHTLEAIEQLRPTDFIKARGNPLGSRSGVWIWFPDTNQHQPISTNINQHQPWFLDCINTITMSMRGLDNDLRLVMIQPMLNVYLLNIIELYWYQHCLHFFVVKLHWTPIGRSHFSSATMAQVTNALAQLGLQEGWSMAGAKFPVNLCSSSMWVAHFPSMTFPKKNENLKSPGEFRWPKKIPNQC